ncbi:ras and Rab interactor 1 [Xenopus tropicalis]|uniref:Ras and Rab interactor 1 n=1 Tax=Xenopus tropicalis TaxID=8364 RepID=A0A7D9NK16_XENTR|nr:ras and Rab interactor 1 [Xenopus tropicalis]
MEIMSEQGAACIPCNTLRVSHPGNTHGGGKKSKKENLDSLSQAGARQDHTGWSKIRQTQWNLLGHSLSSGTEGANQEKYSLCRVGPSCTRMTEPVYDFPYQESSPTPIRKGSPTSVSITDRLLLTQSVWLHRTVNSATALHILQREPPGTFLVRKSNTRQKMVLCVRLSDDSGPSFIHQAYIHKSPAGIYLEESELTFPDLIRLVAHYSSEKDVLPYTLRLPAAIEKVPSRKQLEAISHLGLEFWRSALNARDPLLPSASPSPSPSPPLPLLSPNPSEIPDIITPSLIPSLKTRSPLEVSSGGGEGALCFFNPLFKPKVSGALKRSQFQRSIKVRVSTENSGSLSPPINPPPPVPSQEVVKEEEEERIAPLLASQEAEVEQCQLSSDQNYRKPRSSLRQRLKKSLSKGSMELGLKISQLRSTDGGDYKVPVPLTRTQESKEIEQSSSNGLSPVEVQDSGSSSSEEGTSEDFGKFSPQLTRRRKIKKKSGRSSFRAVSGAFLSLLSPERKVLMFIEEMSRDIQTEFGKELQDFLRRVTDGESMGGKEKDTEDEEGSYKTLLKEVRDFMDKVKHVLRESAELQLETLSLEEQDRVLEKSLHRLILKPLNAHLVSVIHKGVEESGDLERLGKNMQAVKNSGSSLLGVSLMAPTAPELEKIRHKLLRMQEKYSPTDKVRLLLQACRLVYRNIDAQQDDACGADEFLPALCYVLALCDLPQLLIHTYYTGELLPQDTLVGEGGYYLTSVSASLSVLSSLHTHPPDMGLSLSEWHRKRQGLPSLNDLQNFLRVAHQDPVNGCTTKTILLRPSQTVVDLTHLCALKFKPSNPEDYAIFLYCGGNQQLLLPDSQPQQIKAQLKERGSNFYFCYQCLEKEDSTKKDTPQESGNDL